MKRTILVRCLCFVPLAVALAGCTPDSNSKIVLKIGFWPEASETRDVAMYQEWEKAFEADYPQYDVQGAPYTYDTSTYMAKHTTNQLPDVFQTWFTEPSKLKDQGVIRDITSQLDDLGWTDKMDSEMKKTMEFDGKIYGIPRDGYGLGLLINKRILGDCGILPEKTDADGKKYYSLYDDNGKPCYPTTWQEVYDVSRTIVDDVGDSARGFLMYSTNKNGGWIFSNMAWNYGSELEVEENGKWKANLDSDGAVAALEWVKSMKQAGYLQDTVSTPYNDWESSIGERVAMAVVGSDVLQNAKLHGNVDMDDLAFVPMPTGDGVHHYSLYGGTPYVFHNGVSDEKVEGILKFFSYIGRSPETSEQNLNAIKEGYEVAKAKNQPILPSIRPWTNEDYLSEAKKLENEYINVKMEDYSPFFDHISEVKHAEVPYNAQDMYEALDIAISSVLSNPDTANCKALLTTANASLQKKLDSSVNS